MVFSDTTNKNGHIQECEFWTNLGDAGISGNTTLLKIFTARINAGFDRLEPRLLSYMKCLGYDDPNNSGTPTKTANIVSGTNAYTASADANNLAIFQITDVAILQSSSATSYVLLPKITADDDQAPFFVSPNTSQSGVPSKVLILGNDIYFDVNPNYNATNGIKYFVSRQHTRFVSTDTTATAGVPVPFQAILSLYAAHDWLTVNKPENGTLITRLEAAIQKREDDLDAFIASLNPIERRLSPAQEDNQ